MAWHFQRAGFGVDTAGNGWEALECLRPTPPDSILPGLMLPDFDGLGIYEILRRDPAKSKIPIIIL